MILQAMGTGLVAIALGLWTMAAAAETATVAVAANLLPTAERLVATFERSAPHEIAIAHGSSGRLYAQIRSGAPFDIFLSADQERPALLEQEGRTAGRRSYATGLIVLVTSPGLFPDPARISLHGRRLSFADPAVAPYGRAASQALEGLGVDVAQSTVIMGESVGQVALFFATGNVDAAVIAQSQLAVTRAQRPLDALAIDPSLYDPIVQDGVLLKRGADNTAARAFWDWLDGPQARAILHADGYGVVAE